MTEETSDPSLHPQVAAAIARLAARDPETADNARAAWGWLAGDEAPDVLLQRHLQDFLWYGLPRKWAVDLDGQLAVVESLARLFDLLGAERYADLCRAGETREILTAYEEDPEAGFDRYCRAVERSGIDPPNVPELAWGAVMSVDEAHARDHVSARLEDAVDEGRIVPGSRGWRTVQRAVTSAALAEPVPGHPGGQSWLQTVVTSRLESWIERYGPSQARWRLVEPFEAAFLHPVQVPDGAGELVAPLRWLLVRATGDGLPLTTRGNLNRQTVQEICAAFGWEPLGGGRLAQRQDDIVELLVWEEFLRTAGLARRRNGRLVATPAGRDAGADDAAAWRALAAGLVGDDGWLAFLHESALLLLLHAGDDGLDRGSMTAALSELCAEAGWRDQATGEAPSAQDITGSISPYLHHLGLMGLTRDDVPIWQRFAGLVPVGRATVIEALRVRGTAPRSGLHD